MIFHTLFTILVYQHFYLVKYKAIEQLYKKKLNYFTGRNNRDLFEIVMHFNEIYIKPCQVYIIVRIKILLVSITTQFNEILQNYIC